MEPKFEFHDTSELCSISILLQILRNFFEIAYTTWIIIDDDLPHYCNDKAFTAHALVSPYFFQTLTLMMIVVKGLIVSVTHYCAPLLHKLLDLNDIIYSSSIVNFLSHIDGDCR